MCENAKKSFGKCEYRAQEWMVNMPLYNIGNLNRYLESNVV